MLRCFVALGGNLGPVEETFQAAVEAINALPDTTVGRVSSDFRFPAVGEQAGGEFRNAVVEVHTWLGPVELLDRLQSIEQQHGRSRRVHWGPRPLDLDLVFYGSDVIETPRLRVPHPACWYRRFVLDPLAEIAPEFVHPEKGLSIDELRSRLLGRPLPVAIAGATHEDRRRLIQNLESMIPEVLLWDWHQDRSSQDPSMTNSPPESRPDRSDPALLIWLGPDPSAGRAGTDDAGFLSLPEVPRLDASVVESDRAAFVQDIIRSALGA